MVYSKKVCVPSWDTASWFSLLSWEGPVAGNRLENNRDHLRSKVVSAMGQRNESYKTT